MNKQELLSNLKAAETGSVELSAKVFKYFNPDTKWKRSELSDEEVYIIDKYGCLDFPPSLTTSIDAAVKAVRDCLRPYLVETSCGGEEDSVCFLRRIEENGYIQSAPDGTGIHKSLPIAIMIALIEATEEGKT